MKILSEFSFKTSTHGETIYYVRLINNEKYLISWESRGIADSTNYNVNDAMAAIKEKAWILVPIKQKKAEI